jgi:hypothetical protein
MRCEEDPFHGLTFVAVKTLPDNFGDGTIDKGLRSLMRLPADATSEDVVWWVWQRMAEDAVHELRERFRVDGHVVFNPHAQED